MALLEKKCQYDIFATSRHYYNLRDRHNLPDTIGASNRVEFAIAWLTCNIEDARGRAGTAAGTTLRTEQALQVSCSFLDCMPQEVS
jgi:hypothetical protein